MYPRGTPRLQGLKLADGEYRPLPSRLVDGERTIGSAVLGLDVRVGGELLRFRDAATGRHRPEVEADEQRAQAAAERAQAAAERAQAQARREAAARSASQARVAELEAALRRSQPGHPR